MACDVEDAGADCYGWPVEGGAEDYACGSVVDFG